MRNAASRATLALLAISLAVIAACGPGGGGTKEAARGGGREESGMPSYDGVPAEGEPVYGGHLRRNLTSEPEMLNPALTSGLASAYVEEEIFDPIVYFDRNLEYIGRLAESWEISEDKLVYTFTLRPGLKWHDGEPLTAHDVEFTLDMIRDPANQALSQVSEFALVDHLEVVSDRVFKVYYEQVFSPALSAWTLQPIPEHIFQDYYEEHGEIRSSPRNRENVIGSGAYRFVEWQPQTALVLEAWDDYWDGRPYIDQQTIKLMSTVSIQFAAAKAGELDITTMTPEMFRYQVNQEFRDRFNILQYYVWGYGWIGWNEDGSNPFFDDMRVRRAMTMLTDRQRIIDKLNLGFGRIATGPLHPDHWAYPNDIEPVPYDPDAAKTLLAEAGWRDTDGDGWLDKDGVKFSFEIMVGQGSETFQRMAEYLQQEYRKVGIDMQIRNLEWAAFIAQVRDHDFEAVMMSWGMGVDPQGLRNIWRSDMYDEGRNYVGYSNPRVDELLDEGMVTFGRANRAPIYAEVHRLINADQPYTFLTVSPSLVAIHKRFKNVSPSPRGVYRYWPGMKAWYVPKDQQGEY